MMMKIIVIISNNNNNNNNNNNYIIIIIIIISEYFYRVKVSVLYKYIQVKNCYQHLSCVRPLSKKRGEIYFKKL